MGRLGSLPNSVQNASVQRHPNAWYLLGLPGKLPPDGWPSD